MSFFVFITLIQKLCYFLKHFFIFLFSDTNFLNLYGPLVYVLVKLFLPLFIDDVNLFLKSCFLKLILFLIFLSKALLRIIYNILKYFFQKLKIIFFLLILNYSIYEFRHII